MGTSKGYVPPTTPQWTAAKRAVTSYIKKRDLYTKEKAASKYATAMKKDMITGGTFQIAATKTFGFIQKAVSSGVNYALAYYKREDLIGKPAVIVWSELVSEFTNYGSTAEDSMAADALSQALSNFEIEDISEIKSISVDALLKEMLKEFIKSNFDYRYEEKISRGKTSAQKDEILEEMHGYIENVIDCELKLDDLNKVDFTDLSASIVVEDALINAYSIFEKFYGED